MAVIKYNKTQIEELKKNKYVKNCSSKYITFTDEFKIKVLELDKNWIYHRKIFEDFGFPEYIINWNIIPSIVWSWRYKMKKDWLTWLVWTKKGRRKQEKKDFSKMTIEEQNEYLKAENAYLKELHKQVYWHYP